MKTIKQENDNKQTTKERLRKESEDKINKVFKDMSKEITKLMIDVLKKEEDMKIGKVKVVKELVDLFDSWG